MIAPRRLLLAAASLTLLAACSRDDQEEQGNPAPPAPSAPVAPAPQAQSSASARFTVGEAQVTALADGYIQGSLDLLQGITPAESEALLRQAGAAVPPRLSLQAFLVDVGGKRVLIDTGAGSNMGAAAGRFAAALQQAGVTPESVNAVVISHMHPDHVGGLLDAQGKPRFANATVHVDTDEAAFWSDAKRMAAAPEANKPFFQAAQAVLAAYGDKVRRFDGGEIVPGLVAEPIAGHTPGHTAYRLSSGDQQMLFIGDMVHVADVQMPRPEVTLQFDNDPAAAMAMRRSVLTRAAGKPVLVAGPHLPFPGVGRIEASGKAFRFVPVAPPPPAAPPAPAAPAAAQ